MSVQVGQTMSEFPLDPQLAKMLVASPEFRCLLPPGRRLTHSSNAAIKSNVLRTNLRSCMHIQTNQHLLTTY